MFNSSESVGKTNGTISTEQDKVISTQPNSVNSTQDYTENIEFAYVTSLYIHGKPTCSGAILSSRWVVTTAQCTVYQPNDLYIKVGIAGKDAGYGYSVQEVVVHPGFNKETLMNDIGLWKTYNFMEFTTTAHPISILKGFVKGDEKGESYSAQNLKAYSIETIENDKCKATSEMPNSVLDSTLCGVGKDTCSVDTGAPLVIDFKLVGISSWSKGCEKGYPVGFTRIGEYAKWIFENMEKGSGHTIYPGLIITVIALIHGIKSALSH